MRILIAEDDLDIQEELEERLTAFGHNVKLSRNGREAWDWFSSDTANTDIILTDIRMPELDGLGLLKRIREEGHEVPVIVMSGHEDLQAVVQALRLEAFDFLVKPFGLDLLFSTISRIEGLISAAEKEKETRLFYDEELQIRIPSQIKYLPSVIARFNHHFEPLFQRHNLNTFHVLLSVQEALSNAIVHGNLEVSSDLKEESFEKFDEMIQKREADLEFGQRQVRIAYQVDLEKVVFEIEDEGKGFDFSSLPDFQQANNLLVSGRGIFFIRHYMDEVVWREPGNFIRMVKYLRKKDSRDPH